jgi:hypothetical protein
MACFGLQASRQVCEIEDKTITTVIVKARAPCEKYQEKCAADAHSENLYR